MLWLFLPRRRTLHLSLLSLTGFLSTQLSASDKEVNLDVVSGRKQNTNKHAGNKTHSFKLQAVCWTLHHLPVKAGKTGGNQLPQIQQDCTGVWIHSSLRNTPGFGATESCSCASMLLRQSQDTAQAAPHQPQLSWSFRLPVGLTHMNCNLGAAAAHYYQEVFVLCSLELFPRDHRVRRC